MQYFIHIGFDGTSYSGWQKQKAHSNTIQETIENVLFQILKKDVIAHGCGRTDAGVHASQFVFQINLEEAPQFDLKFRLNKNLPAEIAVFEIIEVGKEKHARYDAVSRTYDYFIHTKKDPILSRYSSLYEDSALDFEGMRKAVDLLGKAKDFKPFCKQPDVYKNTLCQISNCELFVDEENGRIRFTITSNRFLRGMIRYSVFFILQVGYGKMTLDEFKDILEQRSKVQLKRPALPNGLFLSKIEYPYVKLTDSHHLIKMLKVGLE